MVSKQLEAFEMTAVHRMRAAILLVGLPTALVSLAHLNIHVASGVPFAPGRLVVPALLGLGLAVLLLRELGRRAEQRAFMASLEVYRVNKLKDPSYVPGDLSLGQGPGRWNPFGFDYTPEEYAEKQLQEIKHCRLAMLGIIGLAAKSSGAGDVGVLAMLGGGKPEFVTKAGFYFPEGI